jgi:MFS family permease
VVTLPIILLIVSSLIVWVVQKRQARISWAIGALAALITWITILLLALIIPMTINLSIWRPEELFRSRLVLSLDKTSWAMIFGLAAVLLSVILISVERNGKIETVSNPLILVYSAFAIAAIMADNLLTIAMSWALMDLTGAILFYDSIRNGEGIKQSISGLAIKYMAVLFVVGAAGVNYASQLGLAGTLGMIKPLAAGMLVVAVLLRLGLFSMNKHIDEKETRLPYCSRILIEFLPAMTGLSALGHQLDSGVPEEILIWVIVVGVISSIWGCLLWGLSSDRPGQYKYLTTGILGISMIVVARMPDMAYEVLSSAAILILICGVATEQVKIHKKAHRIWPITVGVVLAGFIWSPAGTIIKAMSLSIDERGLSIFVIWIIICLGLLSMGAFRRALSEITPWESVEQLARAAYNVGIVLPIMAGFVIGIYADVKVDLKTSLIFLSSILVGSIGFIKPALIAKVDLGSVAPIERHEGIKTVIKIIRVNGLAIGRIIRGIQDIIEGEAAMLWIILILQLIFLILVSA